MQSLYNVRAALGVSDEDIGPIVKNESRIDGGSSQKALVGWEWTMGYVPNRPLSGADKQAVPEMMEELVSPTDSLDTSVELDPAATETAHEPRRQAHSATKPAPQMYSDAPFIVDADTDRCAAYETDSEVNEPDYAVLFAAEINAANKTDEAAPQKRRKRKANHTVDRRPLTRSRV